MSGPGIDIEHQARTGIRHQVFFLLFVAVSLICYGMLGYRFQRYESGPLVTCLLILFTAYGWMISRGSLLGSSMVLIAAILLRLVFLFSMPALSDDVYRFLWDGWLWDHGHDPFLYTPRELMTQGIGEPHLFALLGNRDSHTVYPLIPMGLARIAVHFSDDLNGRIIILRVAHLAAEAGTLLMMTSLFRRWQLPRVAVAAYALNPLVILELTGNLHHEAFVIFFLVAALWMLEQNRDVAAGVLFAGAVSSKLLPMIFLPAWWAALGRKRGTRLVMVVVPVVLISLVPQLTSGFFNGMRSGLELYFNRFEFNASLWYLIRAVGELLAGFNIIRMAGPVMVVCGGMMILYLSLRNGLPQEESEWRKRIPAMMVTVLTVYLVFATTVHPWYLAPLVAFAWPAGHRYPLAWSGLAMFTYLGYHRTGFSEVWWVVLLEYLVVFSLWLYEWRKARTH